MDRTKSLEVALVIVLGLLIFYFIYLWTPLLYAAVAAGGTGVFLQKPAEWISRAWFGLAEILGKVVEKVVLSLLYLVFLIPVSLLFKLFAGDPMQLMRKKNSTLWKNREHEYSRDDMVKPW